MARQTAQKVVTAREHSKYTRQFLELVSNVSRYEGWREYDVLVKWLDAATAALQGQVLNVLGKRADWQANEDRYMKIVESCRQPTETMTALGHMLGCAKLALDQEPKDFIGPIFMELAANEHLGQFFTPDALAEVSARMAIDNPRDMLDHVKKTEGRSWITMQEPACGVGGMVLAANRILREYNLDPAIDAHWTCVDVDWKAVCGCYIQLTLTNTSAVVVHGNTLTLETWGQLVTRAAVEHPKIAINCKEAELVDG